MFECFQDHFKKMLFWEEQVKLAIALVPKLFPFLFT